MSLDYLVPQAFAQVSMSASKSKPTRIGVGEVDAPPRLAPPLILPHFYPGTPSSRLLPMQSAEVPAQSHHVVATAMSSGGTRAASQADDTTPRDDAPAASLRPMAHGWLRTFSKCSCSRSGRGPGNASCPSNSRTHEFLAMLGVIPSPLLRVLWRRDASRGPFPCQADSRCHLLRWNDYQTTFHAVVICASDALAIRCAAKLALTEHHWVRSCANARQSASGTPRRTAHCSAKLCNRSSATCVGVGRIG